MSEKKHKVFVIQNFSEKSKGVFEFICAAASDARVSVFRPGAITGDGLRETFAGGLFSSDLIVADVTDAGPNLMREVGYIEAQNKPLILIANTGRSVPFSLAKLPVLVYDLADPADFVSRLAKTILQALKNRDEYIPSKVTEDKTKRQSVFVSYSHNDQEYLDRLLIHLKPLERDGLIDLWADTKLRAGDRWKKEIEKALQKATVAVLLVSADFLSSDFIINNELPPLLKNAEERGVRIIPVIVKPCRFARDQNLKHFQSVNDPKDSLIRLSVGEQELIYDQVASEIEQNLSKK
jgi:hypothetical protein